MSAQPHKVAVVDYGAGNLRSVAKALERSGLAPVVVSDPEAVRAADAIVLPGVGAFPDAVASLQKNGLDQALCEQIRAGTPYLGLCLGLQLLFDESDDDDYPDVENHGDGDRDGDELVLEAHDRNRRKRC